jgi:hypothetical protein
VALVVAAPVVDAAGSITEQQRLVRQLITHHVHANNVEVADDEPVSA